MEIEKRQKQRRASLYLRCGAIFLLLLLSVLVIACGTNTTATQTDLAGPQVTVTIRFGSNAPPQSTVAPYLCGAWITNTTPGFTPGNEIPVYAHFEHNVNGNPVGI